MAEPTATANPRIPRSRLGGLSLVAALLVLHGAIAHLCVAHKSLTYDEPIQFTGGYAAWTLRDYRMSPASGLLPQLWCALPAALSDVGFAPDTVPNLWVTLRKEPLCQHFLFASGNDTVSLIRAGRSMITLLSVLLGLVTYLASRRLFGPGGGLLTLTLYTFSPTVLAAGSLMTADTASALFFLLATLGVWRVLHRVTPTTVTVSALAVSGMFLAKMSAPTLVFVVLVMLAIRLYRTDALQVGSSRSVAGRGGQVVVFAGVAVVHALVVVFCVWAVHGFRYSAFGPDTPAGATMEYSWEYLLADGGPVAGIIGLARDARFLPEGYLFGLADTFKHAGSRLAFAMGENSSSGWWWFFPYAFLIKTPLALLGLMAWGMFRLRVVGGLYEKTPLLALIGVYCVVALSTSLNIGHRHLLPIYPPLMILAGSVAHVRGLRRWVMRGALLLFLLESLLVFPHFLGFFNVAVGGPTQGYRHLVDSSLDWGQDLPALRTWIDGRRAQGDEKALYLGYFGTHSPQDYGFAKDQMIGPPWLLPTEPPFWLRGGYFAVSATVLQSVYGQLSGRWSEQHEALWRRVSELVRRHRRQDADKTWASIEQAIGRAQMLNARAGYDTLRQLRLCAYLRDKKPLAYAGYSILIFELDDRELATALTGPLPIGS